MKDLNFEQIVDVNKRDRSPLCELLISAKVCKKIEDAKKIATDLRESENPIEDLKEIFASKAPKAPADPKK